MKKNCVFSVFSYFALNPVLAVMMSLICSFLFFSHVEACGAQSFVDLRPSDFAARGIASIAPASQSYPLPMILFPYSDLYNGSAFAVFQVPEGQESKKHLN